MDANQKILSFVLTAAAAGEVIFSFVSIRVNSWFMFFFIAMKPGRSGTQLAIN